MWDPGIPTAESHTARLYGYHRRLCLWSVAYRGTQKNPGLILALAQGGSCRGITYRIAKKYVKPAANYLFEREMVTDAYRPVFITAHLENGKMVNALTFVSRTDHPQYAEKMETVNALKIIRSARGPKGTNLDYVLNTIEHLDALGIQNTELHRIAKLL